MGMKKPLGCLGVFVVLVAVVGIAAYTFLLRPVLTSLNTLQEINQVNERIENRDPYHPPEPGRLEPAQVDRFVAVQRQISDRLEEKVSALQTQYEEAGEEWRDRDPSIREVITVWGDVLQLYAAAKTIQVEALNAQDFSLEEYRHVRQNFYRALGVDLLPYNIDAIAAAADEQRIELGMDEFRIEREEVSEETLRRNRELVSDYTEAAEEWLLFSWWGL